MGMKMEEKSFATAINCMDGRTQVAVIDFMKDRYGVSYVDMVTEPGPIKTLSKNEDAVTKESIRTRVGISVEKHGSKLIAIVGHHDCAGNPVDKTTQIGQITASADTVKSWGFDADIVKLWVGEDWNVYPAE